jgi:hypothetical protein
MTKSIEWRDRMALWLGHAADAAEAVTVTFECELPNGRHMSNLSEKARLRRCREELEAKLSDLWLLVAMLGASRR